MYNREFYLKSLQMREKSPRIFWMAREIRVELSDEDVPFAELVEFAAGAGNVKPKTVKSWLYGAAKHGLVTISGEYVHRAGEKPSDTRTVSLNDWPVPEGVHLG